MAAGGGRKRRKRGGGRALYVTLITALIIFAVITGMGVFFKISVINVTGVSMYDDEQVIEASGIEQGDSIFFIRESASAIKIKKALPYADEVRIVRSLPDTVTIEVTESYPLACVSSGGSWWIIDKNAKVLEETNTSGVSGLIVLKGVTPIMPSVGGTLALGEGQSVKLAYLKAVLSAILSSEMQDNVTWLDMTNISSIRFDYKNLEINVGKGEGLEDKFWLLEKFFEENGEDRSGTVDLSVENEAHYIPG
ncbi:MAG: cell division protein FtsQ/DivIB [Oscillospiraceae bacterium]